MIVYPLEDILRIRDMRVDEAELNVKRLRNELDNAVADVSAQERALDEYRTWRIGEEEKRYETIKKNLCPGRSSRTSERRSPF